VQLVRRIGFGSIRTRLLIAYVIIIVIGFAGLTLVAGGQISTAAEADFFQRLQNEVILIAQGVTSSYLPTSQLTREQLDAIVQGYGAQVTGNVNFIPLGPNLGGPGRGDAFRELPEIETAMRGQVIVVQRHDESGRDMYFTAAPVVSNQRMQGVIQLSVPAGSLQAVITERWAVLALVFVMVTALALAAALWLSRSIILPLYKLRESAMSLSRGNLAHRVDYNGKDEIGEVAQAFNHMAQQVESMLEEQRAFASNTSHELRTPLTTIRLRTESLRYDPTLEESLAKQYIEEIDEEVIRLGNLVQDLTLLSRFDAGRAELGKDQVDMLRFASSMQHQFSPQAGEKNIRIVLELSQQPIPVSASLNHLSVVFRNILDNAIKYTPEGGQITWTITADDKLVYHKIRDTGHGISEADLPHVFERFYRVDKSRSRDTPGTGLGLPLAKSIVEAYHGHIAISSEGLGKGSTVTVEWPCQPVKSTIA
jgi:signal transduction histidine kinase